MVRFCVISPNPVHLTSGIPGKNYFEGWYFKLVDRKMKHAYAFIPGVFFSSVSEHDHAFIQVVDGTSKTYSYKRFSTEDFSAAKDAFYLDIAGNRTA